MQRAELWEGGIAALQASWPIHLGVDNANVVGHVGRILAGRRPDKPYELLVDGDLLVFVQKLVNARMPGTTAVSKARGHADGGLVRGGKVREVDKVGNDMADQAADFGRRGVGADVIDARRNLSTARRSWYPVVRHLHRFCGTISANMGSILQISDFLKTRLMKSDRDQQIRMLFLTQQFRMLFLTQHVELTSHGCVRQEIASVKQNSHCYQNARGTRDHTCWNEKPYFSEYAIEHEIARVRAESHFSEYAVRHEIARVRTGDRTSQSTR